MDTIGVKHKGNITVILVVSLLLLIPQGDGISAQDNEHDTNPERTDSRGHWNKEKGTEQDFYSVIVENNLFRPLGWQAPNRKPKYVLVATLIESHGRMAKALLIESRSNETYYVTTGEKVEDATVEMIESRQVHLNISGEILTLRAPAIRFLNVPNTHVLDSALREKPKQPASMSALSRSHENQISQSAKNWSSNVQKMLDRYRQATPEERHEIEEKMKSRIQQKLRR